MKNKKIILLLTLLYCSFGVLDSSGQNQSPNVIRPRIVGGFESTRGAWPFMVGLFSNGSSALTSRQFCGGTLINAKWVVTASHCIDSETTSSFKVGIGLHDLRTDSGELISVSRIIKHPNFNSTTLENDIALIELSSNSTLGTPINIYNSGSSLSGFDSTAIGWGTTSFNGSSSPTLREVVLPIVSNSTCNSVMGGILSSMVCAGFTSGGKDACQGDSGGPLVIGSGSSAQLVGVTSYGDGCAQAGTYGVWTRASSFASWISGYIQTTSETNGNYGLWNSYLSMINIAELQNTSSSAVTAQVNIFSNAGSLVSSNFVSVPANGQTDVILNELGGFTANSYGIVQISSNVSGRVLFYKTQNGAFTDFEFANSIPFSPATNGTSYASFNTFQPSFNIGDSNNLVANWLSLVNLETSSASFLVSKYLQDGSLYSQESFTLGGRSRVDIEGGHNFPGKNRIGLIEITPSISSTDYTAQLTRYGYSSNGSNFDFSLPLIARAGRNNGVLPLGDSALNQNWIEIINVGSSSTTATLKIYSQSGAQLLNTSFSLSAKSQTHVDASSYIPSGSIGYAEVTMTGSNQFLGQSMTYFRDPIYNAITSISGGQNQLASSSATNGSYNLFLTMNNELKIHNTSSSTAVFNIQLNNLGNTISSNTYSLAANASGVLNLNDTTTFGTSANTYGSIRLTPSSGTLFANTIRVKNDTSSLPEFVVPISFE